MSVMLCHVYTTPAKYCMLKLHSEYVNMIRAAVCRL